MRIGLHEAIVGLRKLGYGVAPMPGRDHRVQSPGGGRRIDRPWHQMRAAEVLRLARLLGAVGCVLLLASCAGAGVAGGLGAGAALAPVIASSLGVSATTLSEVAAAGCAAQAAANAAGAIAQAQGSAAWASKFSDASRIAGFACTW